MEGADSTQRTIQFLYEEQRHLIAYRGEHPCREGNALSTAFKITDWLQDKPLKIKNAYSKVDFSAKVHARSHYTSSTEIIPKEKANCPEQILFFTAWHMT